MSDAQTRELNYTGIVNPAPGQLMGPGLDGRRWAVVGSMYDTAADKTAVTVEEIAP